MTIPRIETERLILRPFDMNDVKTITELLSDPQVHQYLAMEEAPTQEKTTKMVERTLAHWEKHQFGNWTISLKDDPEFMGWCGLGYLDETDEVEILYMLGSEYWGKGYASEAAKATLRFAFEETELERIVALCFEENKGSQNVLQKSGLTYLRIAPYFGFDLMLFESLKKNYSADQAPYILHR